MGRGVLLAVGLLWWAASFASSGAVAVATGDEITVDAGVSVACVPWGLLCCIVAPWSCPPVWNVVSLVEQLVRSLVDSALDGAERLVDTVGRCVSDPPAACPEV